MRLLHFDEKGDLRLTEYILNVTDPYAILSHTWGTTKEEINFQDFVEGSGKTTPGYQKLLFCAKQAARDGIRYSWVDTVCINKSSSAELSEAIVSMFRWYRDSSTCYVYLSDISVPDEGQAAQRSAWEPAFRQSRWWKRGWTLQELLAPQNVHFFSKEGVSFGTKASLEDLIHQIARIPVLALQSDDFSQFTVEERKAWALNRETTRAEDKAYCLLGLFGVFILPMYGEGEDHALHRLQEEINKRQGLWTLQTLKPESSGDPLMTWLQPASVGEDLQELLHRRHPGTCHWIFERTEVIRWNAKGKPILWLHGKPGSGKSVIAATLVERLRKQGTVTAYFFCKFGDDTKRSLESILRTWLFQLAGQSSHHTSMALKCRQKGPGIRSQIELILDALKQIIEGSQTRYYLLVDGFDECDSGAVSFEKLAAFISSLGDRVRFALISRPEPWIKKTLDLCFENKVCNLPVTNKATERDLSLWIRACIMSMHLPDQSFEHLAINKLSRGADGMFLWARFQLEAFEAQFALEDARAVLQNELPQDLETTYDRLLTSIRSRQSMVGGTSALRILEWITLAHRPLAIEELDFALGIHIGSDQAPKARTLLRGKLDVIRSCGSFVEISEFGVIHFIHASAREYLLKKFATTSSAEEIAAACLACLTFLDIEWMDKTLVHVSEMKQLLDKTLGRYNFVGYAAMNWWKHLETIPDVGSELLQHAIRKFLGDSENTVKWLYLYQYLVQYHAGREDKFLDPTAGSGWSLFAQYWRPHLGPNTSNLFSRWQRWHVEIRYHMGMLWLPLHIAAFFNYADVVHNDIKSGLLVDLRDEYSFTPLLQAAHGDSPEAAQVLLDHGADIHARTVLGYTAIRYACRNGLDILPVLLNVGARADRHSSDLREWTSLHEVCSSVLRHPDILRILLDLPYISTFINARDGRGKTALDLAIAIDIELAASMLNDRSYEGLGGVNLLDGTIPAGSFTVAAASSIFSGQGVAAFYQIHRGWKDIGVDTPIDDSSAGLVKALSTWKNEIIRRLETKGAKRSTELNRPKVADMARIFKRRKFGG